MSHLASMMETALRTCGKQDLSQCSSLGLSRSCRLLSQRFCLDRLLMCTFYADYLIGAACRWQYNRHVDG